MILQSAGLVLALLLSALTPNTLGVLTLAPSVSSLDISSIIHQPLYMALDGPNLYVVDGNGGLAKVKTTSFASQGLGAISTTQVFPFPSPGGCCGNFVYAFGLVIRNGFAWISANYNGGYALARVSLTNFTANLFFQSDYQSPVISGLAADDNYIYAAFAVAGKGIARFQQTDHVWSALVPGISSLALLLQGNTLWFTRFPQGIGRINTDGSGLVIYSSGFTGFTSSLANSTDGRMWFSEPRAHKIGVLNPADGSVVERDFPIQSPYCFSSLPCDFQDGPIGLTFDGSGKLWVAGHFNGNVREFDPILDEWNMALNLNFSGLPYFLVRDGNRVWGDTLPIGALGKIFPDYLFEISPVTPPVRLSITVRMNASQPIINVKSHEEIPIAILSTQEFDATSMVNKTSLTFGRTGFETSLVSCQQHPIDVNHDGLADVVCRFSAAAAGFRVGDTLGFLRGMALDDRLMEASTAVAILS